MEKRTVIGESLSVKQPFSSASGLLRGTSSYISLRQTCSVFSLFVVFVVDIGSPQRIASASQRSAPLLGGIQSPKHVTVDGAGPQLKMFPHDNFRVHCGHRSYIAILGDHDPHSRRMGLAITHH